MTGTVCELFDSETVLMLGQRQVVPKLWSILRADQPVDRFSVPEPRCFADAALPVVVDDVKLQPMLC